MLFGLTLFLLSTAGSAQTLAVEAQGRLLSESGYALFALPGESLEIYVNAVSVSLEPSLGTVEFLSSGLAYGPSSAGSLWRWTAPPDAGEFGTLIITANDGSAELNLSMFVLVPAQAVADGYIGEFRVDAYPLDAPRDRNSDYVPPAGFIEVTPQNRDSRISPHFRIGQFVSKQQGGWPKYVAPGPTLYAKLELLLAAVNEAGFAADTLHVMSGYRTPFYNHAIGNVRFSRHIYGDAADVFVDIDENTYMDDLNGDGRVSVDDARVMASWLEGLGADVEFAPLSGGLGIYDANKYHGPFIHVDTRGHSARWGLFAD